MLHGVVWGLQEHACMGIGHGPARACMHACMHGSLDTWATLNRLTELRANLPMAAVGTPTGSCGNVNWQLCDGRIADAMQYADNPVHVCLQPHEYACACRCSREESACTMLQNGSLRTEHC